MERGPLNHSSLRLFSRQLVSYFLVFLVVTVLAVSMYTVAPAKAVVLPGTEQQITTNPASQTDPAISGNNVVYTDDRNGNQDIYFYNITSGEETNLNPGIPNNQYLDDISGNQVVYTGVTSTGADIWLYNLYTNLEIPLDSSGTNYWPSIDEDLVAWIFRSGADYDVILANLTERRATTLASASYVSRPRISDGLVVWAEDIGGWDQIRSYNCSSGEYLTITNGLAAHKDPDISGNKLVWISNEAGNWDVYLHDLTTQITTQLTYNSADQLYPRISGNNVIWEDTRSGTHQIWFMNLDEGLEMPVYPTGHTQILPAIDGNRILWSESRYGNFDIFMFTIGGAPTASFSYTPELPRIDETVTFDASSSTPQTDITEYKWNFGDGQTTATANPMITHTYMLKGTYTITLTVKDSTERESTTTKTLTVTEQPQPVGGISTSLGNPQMSLTYYLGLATIAASITILSKSIKRKQRNNSTNSASDNGCK